MRKMEKRFLGEKKRRIKEISGIQGNILKKVIRNGKFLEDSVLAQF